MVGGPDDQQTIVVFQAVELVQEERAVAVVDQTIQILKDHNAGRFCPGLSEDLGDCGLLTCPTCWWLTLVMGRGGICGVISVTFERFYVEWRVAFIEGVFHDSFDANGLPITRGTIHNDTSLRIQTLGSNQHVWGRPYLPGDLKVQVDAFRREETKNILLKRGLELLIEDYIGPIRLLDLLPQSCVPTPVALFKHPNFIVQGLRPASCSNEQVLAGLFGRPLMNEELVYKLIKTLEVLQNLVSC